MLLLEEPNGDIENETWEEMGYSDSDDDDEAIGDRAAGRRKERDGGDRVTEGRGSDDDLEARGRARVIIRAMAGKKNRGRR